MFYPWATEKELCGSMEELLLDSKIRIASSEDVGTSMEVKRRDIRLAAKNVVEVGKILKGLITMRGPFASNLVWRFISAQRMYAEIKKEIKGWTRKLFGTEHLDLSSFENIYEHIEKQFGSSISGQFRRFIF